MLALLLAAVALLEAVPRPARPEAPPAFFHPPDHAAGILPATGPPQPRKFAARTSENPLKPKFAESLFHALG